MPFGARFEANKNMMNELKELKKAPPKAVNYRTPPPRVSAPSPSAEYPKRSSPDKLTPRALNPQEPQQRPPPATEGAKPNRLRRLCEVKPSGRCHVPTEVHERWKKSTKEEKEAMIEELELVNWNKDSSWAVVLAIFHPKRENLT